MRVFRFLGFFKVKFFFKDDLLLLFYICLWERLLVFGEFWINLFILILISDIILLVVILEFIFGSWKICMLIFLKL